MTDNTTRIWLITGATSGFGHALAEAALAKGDVVVGAGRRPEGLTELAATYPHRLDAARLDVTDMRAITAMVDDVIERHGRVDVLVNNAGRTQVGAVEETTDDELRDLFDLHLFGPAALTRAVLPHMRQRRSGAIVMLSSMGGQMSGPGFSAYSATKFALEGLSEALIEEVAPHGIRVLVVEPGAFRTNLFAPDAAYFSRPLDAYADIVGGTRTFVRSGDGAQPGDPAKAASAIISALEADRTPLHLPLGGDAVDAIRSHHERFLAELDAWEHVARDTQFETGVVDRA